jgi:DNA-binding MarR family transcriptional regulator
MTALPNDSKTRRTPKGKRAFQRAHQQRLQQLAVALSNLPPEQLSAMRGLATALERLTTVLDE